MDVWKDLEPLFRNRDIGAPAIITFGRMWELTGAEPGELTITTKELQKLFARDRSSLLAHFKQLNRVHRLLDMVWRDRSGRFQFNVYRPAAGHAEAKPDLQKMLPGMRTDDIIAEAVAKGLSAKGYFFKPFAPAEVSGSNCEEFQRSGQTGEFQRLAMQSAPEGRGENPTVPAGPWGNPHAPSVSIVGNSPRSPEDGRGEFPTDDSEAWRGEFPTTREDDRGEIPTHKNTSFSAEKEGVGKFPIPSQRERGEFPTALACAPASLKDSSKEESTLKGFNDSKTLKAFKDTRGAAEKTVGNSPRQATAAESEADAAEREALATLARIQRDIDRRRAAQEARQEATEPVTKSDELMSEWSESLAGEHFSAEAQKRRVFMQLKTLVNDARTADWLFGYAADLLIVHGQNQARPDAAEIFNRMSGIIEELKEERAKQDRLGYVRGPRGAWFNIRVQAIARDFGIKLPCELKAEREAKQRATEGVPQ